MKVIYVSNFINFHQTGLWDEFTERDVNFIFLETSKITEERIKMHYKDTKRGYIKRSYNLNNDELKLIFFKADFVILGSVDDKRIFACAKMVPNVIFNSEHQFKKRSLKNPISFVKRFCLLNLFFRNNNKFALCNSYYAAKEYKRYLIKENRIFKFGYFPKMECHLKEIINDDFMFCGRMIKWKNPKDVIRVFSSIKTCKSKLYFVGEGPELENIKKYAKRKKVYDSIVWLPFVSHLEIISLMKQCTYYFFASNHREGWGAVLNEAMAQGCIVFANKKAGSTNYLVKNKVNGFTYTNYLTLKKNVKEVLRYSNGIKLSISREATKTVSASFNNVVAANRLYITLKSIIDNKKLPSYSDGPMSLSC